MLREDTRGQASVEYLGLVVGALVASVALGGLGMALDGSLFGSDGGSGRRAEREGNEVPRDVAGATGALGTGGSGPGTSGDYGVYGAPTASVRPGATSPSAGGSYDATGGSYDAIGDGHRVRVLGGGDGAAFERGSGSASTGWTAGSTGAAHGGIASAVAGREAGTLRTRGEPGGASERGTAEGVEGELDVAACDGIAACERTLEALAGAGSNAEAERVARRYDEHLAERRREAHRIVQRLTATSSRESARRWSDALDALGPRHPTIRYAGDDAGLRAALEKSGSSDIVFVGAGAAERASPQLVRLAEGSRATLVGHPLSGGERLAPGFGPATITERTVRNMDDLTTVHGDRLEWSEHEELYPGVDYKRGRLHHDGRESEVHVVYAELARDDVSLVATEPGDGSQTTSSWARANDVEIAINGDFFKGASSYGDWMGGGERWEPTYPSSGWAYRNYGSLAFGDDVVSYTHSKHVKENADAYRDAGFSVDGGYGADTVGTTDYPDGVTEVISGFSELVIEGEPRQCPSPAGDCFGDRGDLGDRNPRTAVGVSGDGRYAVFVVVEGRGKRGSAGVNGAELAGAVHAVGAWQAINVDGGGSSTMYTTSTDDGDGEVRNVPSDGRQRVVLNHIGLQVGD